MQFLTMTLGIMLMAILGLFSVHRHGSVNAASVMLYALTSLVAGLVSATLYKRMDGTNWVSNINLTTVLFTGVQQLRHSTVYLLGIIMAVLFINSQPTLLFARL